MLKVLRIIRIERPDLEVTLLQRDEDHHFRLKRCITHTSFTVQKIILSSFNTCY